MKVITIHNKRTGITHSVIRDKLVSLIDIDKHSIHLDDYIVVETGEKLIEHIQGGIDINIAITPTDSVSTDIISGEFRSICISANMTTKYRLMVNTNYISFNIILDPTDTTSISKGGKLYEYDLTITYKPSNDIPTISIIGTAS